MQTREEVLIFLKGANNNIFINVRNEWNEKKIIIPTVQNRI